MSSPAEMITLLKLLEGQGSRKSQDFDVLKVLQWQERRKDLMDKKKEEEDKKKKEKEKQAKPVFTYAEFVFWLCAVSPFAGAAMVHLENALFRF